MRDDIWIERAALLEPFDGKGLPCSEVARQVGLTAPTVKRYGERFGFDFVTRPPASEFTVKLQQLSMEGKTRKEAAELLGVSYARVARCDVDFDHGRKRKDPNQREEAMAAMYRGGQTLDQIGKIHGVTRERVRQILKKYFGITSVDGGRRKVAERKRAIAKAKRESACLERHGCSYRQYRKLVDMGKDPSLGERSPTRAFARQRQTAKQRGIEWNLKIWDWWDIWQQSGKWDHRGRSKDGYVMCRFKDDGPYEAGNVYIATLSHNSSFQPNNPYRAGHPEHDKVMAIVREKIRDRKRVRRDRPEVGRHGLPVGVYFTRGRYRAQISISGKIKYLGSFDSSGLAERAVLDALRKDFRPAFQSLHTTPTVSEARG